MEEKTSCIQSINYGFFLFGIIVTSKTFGFLFNHYDFEPNGTVFSEIEIPIARVMILKKQYALPQFSQQDLYTRMNDSMLRQQNVVGV
jgi:hypothetical protein